MYLPELCIRRPVLATVINIFIVLLGLVAYDRLGVREYPNIDEPIVTVQTSYLGASAEIMETQVTKTLEDSLAGIEDIEVMSSISRAENSQITIRFKISRDPDAAANDVRDRVARVRKRLPDEVDDPVVSKVEADAQPIVYISLNSSRHTPMEITDYAERYLRDRLQNISGVANAMILGERRKSMRIWIDPQKLAAAQLTPADVEDALRRQNIEIPAGRIESSRREFTVLSETDMQTPAQFESLILKRDGTRFTRLRDIGHAEIAPEDERRVVRFNGNSAIALGIIKQSTANPLDVSNDIRRLLPDIIAGLPDGMNLSIASDSSVFIDRSIRAVFVTIIEAIILVLAVIFFFLRNWRSTLIPLVTIPISLVGVFFVMYLSGYSLNTLTLLAFVLAIGLVVDDAIVVLENIYRHIENGMKPFRAAIKGGTEIGFAIVAMTITLAAVYAPIAFTEGKTGKLFIEFAMTLAGAVIISGIIALTLTPMMCSKLLKHTEKHGTIYTFIEKRLNGMTRGYRKLLALSMQYRAVIVVIGLLVAGANVFFFSVLRSELAPIEDRGNIVVTATGPEGATIHYMAEWMQKIEGVYKTVPEIERALIIAGTPTVSQGLSIAHLTDWESRTRKQQDITRALAPKIQAATPGIMAFPSNRPSLGGSPRSRPFTVVLLTSNTYDALNKTVDRVMQDLSSYPGLINLDTDIKMNKPQISVNIDRDKTAAVNADIDTIGRTLETLLGGRKVTRFKDGGEQYDVIVQMTEDNRAQPQDMLNIYIRTQDQQMVMLSNLLDIRETVAPRELNHFNQLRAAKITGNIAAGYTLGDALAHFESRAADILPADTMYDYDGESREFQKSNTSLMLTFLLALAFIYLVLAAQFESFISPFVIILSVPLSIAGALFALYMTGGTLNIYSQIGLVTLIGLITKHGILIVEFANQQQIHHSLPKMTAVTKAAVLRLRPILMTTSAMVLGAVPLALASGAGAESRQQIGWVIIGGMTIGTFFTLFVVPVAYSLLARQHTPRED